MLTYEQRVNELHQRMDVLIIQKYMRRYRLQCAGAGAVCVAILAILVFIMSSSAFESPAIGPGSISASIFAEQSALGYVVIAMLAFTLGALFTVFCFRLRRHMEETRDGRLH